LLLPDPNRASRRGVRAGGGHARSHPLPLSSRGAGGGPGRPTARPGCVHGVRRRRRCPRCHSERWLAVTCVATVLLDGRHLWRARAPLRRQSPHSPSQILSFAGHGTFVAGLVRTIALSATVWVGRMVSGIGEDYESLLVSAVSDALDATGGAGGCGTTALPARTTAIRRSCPHRCKPISPRSSCGSNPSSPPGLFTNLDCSTRATSGPRRHISQPEHENTGNPGRNRGTYLVTQSLAEDK
jgi:hypothetical protein